MDVAVVEAGVDALAHYASIPTAFEVSSELHAELIAGGLGGIVLNERKATPPYRKDYDAYEGCGVEHWAERFDVSRWGFFLARHDERPVGGAAVAFDTPGLHTLSGRRDLAALWDLRVHPHFRRRGIGTRLLDRAAHWSRRQGCRYLKIETQNVNVAACRFYAKQGCHLGCIDRYGYAGHPEVGHEVMLIWYLEL